MATRIGKFCSVLILSTGAVSCNSLTHAQVFRASDPRLRAELGQIVRELSFNDRFGGWVELEVDGWNLTLLPRMFGTCDVPEEYYPEASREGNVLKQWGFGGRVAGSWFNPQSGWFGFFYAVYAQEDGPEYNQYPTKNPIDAGFILLDAPDYGLLHNLPAVYTIKTTDRIHDIETLSATRKENRSV